jgi:hypothetical protein
MVSPSRTQALPIRPFVLYRIVRTDPPTLLDVTSKAALGLVDPDADDETKRLESGLSMYRTLAQARRKARSFRFLGSFIATMDFTGVDSVVIERTTSSSGHYTVWGEAALILRCVVAVEPV